MFHQVQLVVVLNIELPFSNSVFIKNYKKKKIKEKENNKNTI